VAGPLAVGAIAARPDGLRVAVALAAALLLLGLGLVSPRALLVALVLWIFALGTTRRVISLDTARGDLDPLLVVAPLGLAVLVLVSARAGAFRLRTPLGSAVLVLAVLVALSALNPLQGSASAGVIGAVLLLTPIAGFWIGRSLDDEAFATVCRLVAALGPVAAAYGLVQVFDGFPAWDRLWITQFGYEALNVGGITRPFSSFASSAEYVLFVAASVVTWIAFATARRQLIPAATALVALLGSALVLGAGRAAVFATVVAAGALACARLRVPPVAAAAAAVALVLLVTVVATRLAPETYGPGEASNLVAHQVEGLSDPVNSDASTLSLHLGLALDGFESALREPLGLGPGPVTNASLRLGGQARGTELDPSNVAVALGIPGLIAYTAVLGIGLARAYEVARRRRDALALAALGLLAVTVFQWLNAGFYLVALLPWLALGWIDRAARDDGGGHA
jgi:hypothetical protein